MIEKKKMAKKDAIKKLIKYELMCLHPDKLSDIFEYGFNGFANRTNDDLEASFYIRFEEHIQIVD